MSERERLMREAAGARDQADALAVASQNARESTSTGSASEASRKALIDDAEQALIDACDTDDVYWCTLAVGQDTEEAESSGYLQGYRDALAAVQQLIGHNNADPLNQYVTSVRGEMREQQTRVEEEDPGPHFWTV